MPSWQMKKLKALTHFIVHKCRNNPSRLRATRLNKALWFADTYAYAKYGRSITGDSYVKRQNGPVPKNILKTVDALKSGEMIVVQEPDFKYDSRKYISLVTPDDIILNDDDKEIAEIAVNLMCNTRITELSNSNHDIVWHAAAMGEEIPIYAILASHEGEITNKVINWATSSISIIKAA